MVSVSLLGGCGAPDEQTQDSTPVQGETARDAIAGDVKVTLSVPRSSLAAREAVMVSVTLTNVSKDTVRLLKWHTAADGLKEDLFAVTVNGQKAEYNGRHYKWATPVASDFLRLAPGESVSHDVDLGAIYDLSVTGAYSIRYDSDGHHSDVGHEGLSQLRSDALALSIEGRPFVHPVADSTGVVTAQALSTSSCTGSRPAATVTTAFTTAQSMTNGAVTYLNGTIGPRFSTWFGTINTTNVNLIKTHYAAIKTAFDTKSVIVDCACSDSAYAYVYKNQPYRIYVCNAFWSAPMSGTDSKGGTLVHEMSHFTVVADTDDWAYGQSACKSLTSSNQTRARDNADSHEYFAENTPAQN
ncbi:M35 family metallo-endopeptidase [Myxococcus dinghuensis]|uniref:M35 family metallo-endopeptidase n=1 Tax=Myxococcus dinghuensis TaxID=2906761 RepID=UPI002B1EFB2B|nr:M35 family metallo-endopeptidase [Myxococcus dinghuensis]